MAWYIPGVGLWFFVLAVGAYGFAGWCHLVCARERDRLRGENAALREEMLSAIQAAKDAWMNALSVNCVQTAELKKALNALQATVARSRMEIAGRRDAGKDSGEPLGPDDFPEWPKEFKDQIDWGRFTG